MEPPPESGLFEHVGRVSTLVINISCFRYVGGLVGLLPSTIGFNIKREGSLRQKRVPHIVGRDDGKERLRRRQETVGVWVHPGPFWGFLGYAILLGHETAIVGTSTPTTTVKQTQGFPRYLLILVIIHLAGEGVCKLHLELLNSKSVVA